MVNVKLTPSETIVLGTIYFKYVVDQNRFQIYFVIQSILKL